MASARCVPVDIMLVQPQPMLVPEVEAYPMRTERLQTPPLTSSALATALAEDYRECSVEIVDCCPRRPGAEHTEAGHYHGDDPSAQDDEIEYDGYFVLAQELVRVRDAVAEEIARRQGPTCAAGTQSPGTN